MNSLSTLNILVLTRCHPELDRNYEHDNSTPHSSLKKDKRIHEWTSEHLSERSLHA